VLVNGTCFWYLWRQIDLVQLLSTVPLLDFRWAAFADLAVVQTALLGCMGHGTRRTAIGRAGVKKLTESLTLLW
jgi:hypothetical protein